MPSKLKDHQITLDGRDIVAKSYVRNSGCAPRKLRLLGDTIRNKGVLQALEILAFSNRPSARPTLEKALKAAIAAAREQNIDPGTLVVGELIVNEAPMLKRIRAASMGRAVRVRKRQSHLFLALTTE